MTLQKPTPPEKRSEDISGRVRTRLWACVVYVLTPGARSWDSLDARWLPEIDRNTPTDLIGDRRGRRRVFHRFYYGGSNPGVLRGLNGGHLTDVIHKTEGLEPAKALFESPFWELTDKQEMPIAMVRPLHLALMDRLGVLRLTPTERILARRAGFPPIVHEHRNLGLTKRAALEVAKIGSLDAIALLACAFLLAKDALSLREADVYLDAIRHSISVFIHRWQAGGEAYTSLARLVERRILRRTAEPIKPQDFGFWVRKRAKNYDPNWNKDSFIPSNTIQCPVQPESSIVRLDPSLSDFFAAFEDHYSPLRTELLDALRAHAAEHEGAQGMTSSPSGDLPQVEINRARLIDSIMLDALNSHDGSASAMIAHLTPFRASGGLPRMIGDLLNPPRRRKLKG